MSDIEITLAGTAAAVRVAEIQADCSANPWSVSDWTNLLAEPLSVCLVANRGCQHIGFVAARKTCDEAEILFIGVSASARRRGVARSLLGGLLTELERRQVCSLFLEVSEANRAARALYQEFGFEEIGRRAGYYRSTGEETQDALVLSLKMGG